MKVHSNMKLEDLGNKNFKQRYWVTEAGKTVFESEHADVALQWAINHSISGTVFSNPNLVLDESRTIQGKINPKYNTTIVLK